MDIKDNNSQNGMISMDNNLENVMIACLPIFEIIICVLDSKI